MSTYINKQTRRPVRAMRITFATPGLMFDPIRILVEGDREILLPMQASMGKPLYRPVAGDYVIDPDNLTFGGLVIQRAQFEAEFEPAAGTPPFPAAAPAPGELPTRVTKEALEAMFAGVAYEIRPDGRTTVCEITFKNGFTLRDESSCAVASEFNAELGREYAYEKALDKAWAFAGFLLMEDRYRAGKA